ncbi:hypothetical protein A2333_00355 [Candidatus Wolfebacteria bacterium RIFOXYB2_FULL_49_7]|uniref:NYN domain-containing protein n=1 Tax=Candidatus Wolfebacteria bacterium RIFOXYB1_FULL_54_12 TaxID=1802559 RepID=A0A1F8DV64_9BACT|nr:MAG: hypothetical protein A2372_00445 [Candidatus Wolfebacteria bacterium RIFOXYB1_FULL_54_12]OGM95702.1 MAG: hypothetical protein A2333_00355 [Candidatus Wolfebacteria bacterium RIFOXYB2_FULL_49_7]
MKNPPVPRQDTALSPLHIHRGNNARVGVFFDAENLFISLQQSSPSKTRPRKLDYQKILERCLNGRAAYCARFYDVISDRYPVKIAFLTAVEQYFEVLTKPLRIYPDGTTKGDWDIGIAIDMVDFADKLDVVVLGSGDGDFIPVVNYLQQKKHCRVEGISFGHSTHPDLLKALDSHINLADPVMADLYKIW